MSIPLNFRSPNQIFVTDCDGDRVQDLLITVSGTKLAPDSDGLGLMVLRGRGDGGFLPGVFTPKNPNSGARVLGLAATADFNGDGRLDVAMISEASITVLAADGPCSFMDRTERPGGAASLAAADFDGDGIVDLATVNNDNLSLFLEMLYGQGDGTFRAGTRYPLPQRGAWLTAGDLNGDARLDLIVSGHDVGPAVFLQQPGGALLNVGSAGAGADLEYPVVADFDGDGIVDVAGSGVYGVAPTGLRTYLGRRPFAWTGPAVFPVDGLPYLPVAADFDSDGLLDVALNNNADFSIVILRATSAARFDAGRRWAFDRGTNWVTPGDFNGDGKPDLVFSQSFDWQVTVMLNSTLR